MLTPRFMWSLKLQGPLMWTQSHIKSDFALGENLLKAWIQIRQFIHSRINIAFFFTLLQQTLHISRK